MKNTPLLFLTAMLLFNSCSDKTKEDDCFGKVVISELKGKTETTIMKEFGKPNEIGKYSYSIHFIDGDDYLTTDIRMSIADDYGNKIKDRTEITEMSWFCGKKALFIYLKMEDSVLTVFESKISGTGSDNLE